MKATQYQIDKATMILDNTYYLYEREQAIFKIMLRDKDYVKSHRQLKDLSREVVAKTNLSETADPFMSGKIFDEVAQAVYDYMLDDYNTEFVKWNEVVDGQVVTK